MGLLTSENSNITINPDKSPYENAKVSFTLSVLPSDFFVVKDGPGHLKETISVSLLSGRVNQLKPGMEGILGAAYNHN